MMLGYPSGHDSEKNGHKDMYRTCTIRKTHGTPWDIVDTMGGGSGRVSHVFSHSAFTLMAVPLATGPVAE